jgi:hypothetical protein
MTNGSGCDAGVSGEELTTSLSHDFSLGQTDGLDAVNSLNTFGMGGEVETVRDYSYTAGLYANPGPSPNVFIQYLESATGTEIPNYIWTADVGGSDNVWGINGLGDGYWSDDQRISQWSHGYLNCDYYSGAYHGENRNGSCLTVDHDCAITALAGTLSAEPGDSESGGESGEDPNCGSFS